MSNGNTTPDFIPATPQQPSAPDFIPAAPATPAAQQPSVAERVIAGLPFSGEVKGVARTAAGLLDLANTAIPTGGTAVPQVKTFTDWVRAHTQPLNSKEEIENLMETVGELAVPGAGEEQVANLSQRLLQGSKIAKILEDYPTINAAVQAGRAAVKGSIRGGTELGAQTYVKTGGDVAQTEHAATTGAVTGGILGGGATALTEGAKLLRPSVETLEGIDLPVAAADRPNPSVLTKLAGPTREIPALAAAQQAAVPQIIHNGAQRAVQTALDEVNQTRGAMEGPSEEYGIPAGTFKFIVEPHGAPVETTDPAMVQKLLNEAQDIQRSDEFQQLGPRHQARINNNIDSLTQQLEDYHNELAGRKHFTPIDTDAAVANTENYRDAGTMLQNSVRDIYQRLDPETTARIKVLAQRPENDTAAQEELQRIFEANRTKIDQAEWQPNVDVYRKGFALQALQDAVTQEINRPFNRAQRLGVEKRPLDEVMQGYGDDIRSMIGDQGVSSLKRMTDLMRTPETAEGLQELLRNVAMYARRHYRGIGGMVGGLTAPLFGVTHPVGVSAGIVGGYALRRIIQGIASDPAITDRAVYAVLNQVRPSAAGPIIASMLARGTPAPTITPEPAAAAAPTQQPLPTPPPRRRAPPIEIPEPIAPARPQTGGQ